MLRPAGLQTPLGHECASSISQEVEEESREPLPQPPRWQMAKSLGFWEDRGQGLFSCSSHSVLPVTGINALAKRKPKMPHKDRNTEWSLVWKSICEHQLDIQHSRLQSRQPPGQAHRPIWPRRFLMRLSSWVTLRYEKGDLLAPKPERFWIPARWNSSKTWAGVISDPQLSSLWLLCALPNPHSLWHAGFSLVFKEGEKTNSSTGDSHLWDSAQGHRTSAQMTDKGRGGCKLLPLHSHPLSCCAMLRKSFHSFPLFLPSEGLWPREVSEGPPRSVGVGDSHTAP